MAEQETLEKYVVAVDRALKRAPLADDVKEAVVSLFKELGSRSLEPVAQEAAKNVFRAPGAAKSDDYFCWKVSMRSMNDVIGPFLNERGADAPLIRDISRLIYVEMGGKTPPKYEIIEP